MNFIRISLALIIITLTLITPHFISTRHKSCHDQNVAADRYYGGKRTKLMDAAKSNNIAEARRLIEAGADVNAIEGHEFPRSGYPVLRYAIDSGSIEMVNLLINHGANTNFFTTSPIDTKRTHANVRNLPLLSHAIKVDASKDMLETLIRHGANVNQKPPMGQWTPLMVAAYYGRIQAVKLLLAHGADKNAKNKHDDNKTAYDYALENGHKDIAALLK